MRPWPYKAMTLLQTKYNQQYFFNVIIPLSFIFSSKLYLVGNFNRTDEARMIDLVME